MGFFSDLKEDLSQAVNELMPEEKKSTADQPAQEPEVSLEEMLKNIDDYRLPEETEASGQEVPQPENSEETAGFDMAAEAADYGESDGAVPGTYGGAASYDGQQASLEEPGAKAAEDGMEELLARMLAEGSEAAREEASGETVPEEALSEAAVRGEEIQYGTAQENVTEEAVPAEVTPDEVMSYETAQEETASDETIIEESKGEEEEMDMEMVRERGATDETSIITEGMTITGDISTHGSIDVIGTVNGNIDAMGKLNITGHVNGNSKAAEIYAESAKINGEIVSEGAVKIGSSSVIIGNITATSAAIAGAVKGDIDVKGPVILDASAIVMGNIKSKSVQINNGAVIEGMCSQCYADVSPTSFFDEYKPEGIRKAKAKQGEQRDNKS